jgi:hypothetical protein
VVVVDQRHTPAVLVVPVAAAQAATRVEMAPLIRAAAVVVTTVAQAVLVAAVS